MMKMPFQKRKKKGFLYILVWETDSGKKKKKNKWIKNASVVASLYTYKHKATQLLAWGGGVGVNASPDTPQEPPVNTPHNLWTQERSSKNLHRRRRGLAPETKGIFSLLQINTAIFKCLHTASRTCLHTHKRNSSKKKIKKASYHLFFFLLFCFSLNHETLTTCKQGSV